MSKLGIFAKFAIVIGGYLAACLAASAVVYVWQLLTQDASAQASAGMYAGGDFFLFIAVFGLLALIPTGLGFFFLIRKFFFSKAIKE